MILTDVLNAYSAYGIFNFRRMNLWGHNHTVSPGASADDHPRPYTTLKGQEKEQPFPQANTVDLRLHQLHKMAGFQQVMRQRKGKKNPKTQSNHQNQTQI